RFGERHDANVTTRLRDHKRGPLHGTGATSRHRGPITRSPDHPVTGSLATPTRAAAFSPPTPPLPRGGVRRQQFLTSRAMVRRNSSVGLDQLLGREGTCCGAPECPHCGHGGAALPWVVCETTTRFRRRVGQETRRASLLASSSRVSRVGGHSACERL